MKVYRGSRFYNGRLGGVLTIGVFDGFHCGHQKLVNQVIDQAHSLKRPSILYSFDPHPLQVVHPDKGICRLFPVEDLMDQTAKMGLDYFVLEEFSKEFSRLSDESFFNEYIYKVFQPSKIIVGYDFCFGFKKGGNVETLKNWEKKYSFQLTVCTSVEIEGQAVSSSRLRQAYQDFDFPLIKKLAGRPFSFKAKVISGKARGRKLGFPTANLKTNSILPKKGVYVCRLKAGRDWFRAVMNIGSNPTFENSPDPPIQAEAHIIEPLDLDLYGKDVEVEVLNFLRDEQRFDNPDQLAQAICHDVEEAQIFFQGFNSKKS